MTLGVQGLVVVAVAKGADRRAGQEQLFLAGQEAPLILAPDSPALRLIQRIRDEAHRFAITGHRRSREGARRRSPLEEIPGLGPKRRTDLLKAFGGLQGIRKASIEDLAKVHGISRTLAAQVFERIESGTLNAGELRQPSQRPDRRAHPRRAAGGPALLLVQSLVEPRRRRGVHRGRGDRLARRLSRAALRPTPRRSANSSIRSPTSSWSRPRWCCWWGTTRAHSSSLRRS